MTYVCASPSIGLRLPEATAASVDTTSATPVDIVLTIATTAELAAAMSTWRMTGMMIVQTGRGTYSKKRVTQSASTQHSRTRHMGVAVKAFLATICHSE